MERNKLTFGFIYDSNNMAWNPEPTYQEAFLRAQEAYLNDRLRAGTFITANDVMEGFGLHRSVSGMVYGWDQDDRIELKMRREEDGTVVIEFTAFNIYEEMSR